MVDVFFVQFIDGIDVPVIIQRRGLLSVLGNVVDMPVASLGCLLYRKLWSFRSCTSMSAGAVHRGLWTSLCSCRDVFCSLGQGRLHAVASNDWCLRLTVQKTVESPQLHVDV